MPKHQSLGTRGFSLAAFSVCLVALFIIAPVEGQEVSPRLAARAVAAVYTLGGQPTGTYHESTMPDVNGGVVTSIESDLIFNRMGTKLEMKFTTQYHEDGQGHLKTVSSEQSSSQQGTRIDVHVGDGSLAVTTTTGGKSYPHDTRYSGALLGPDGARHLLVSRLHVPGDSVAYQTFSAELSSVATITSTLVGNEDVTFAGQHISGLKIEQSIDVMPGKSTLWIDHEGWLLRQVVPSPLGEMEALRVEGEQASPAATGATLPEETFSRSIVKANVRLPEERLVEEMRLKLIHKRPELGWPELEAENQQVIAKTANYVVLEVRRVKPKVAAGRPASDASAAPFLAPNALMQSDDANIQAIAAKVVGNEHDAWRAAQALQRWTNDNMKFDMGIAIAPASEVARNRRGTCFGYSMLLGSLLRAAGIPSRLRMGYVYAGGIWGGHAWIEVGLATAGFRSTGRFTRRARPMRRVSVSSPAPWRTELSTEWAGSDSFSAMLTSKILQYTVDGKSVDVAEGAPAFTVSGNDYRNPWIGLSIRKPPSFKFGDLGAAWPQGDLVSMEGARGETIKVKNLSASLPTGEFDLRQEFAEEGIRGKRAPVMIDGRKGTLVSSGHKAEAVLVSGGNIWAITSAGPHAKALLEQVLATMRLDN